MLTILIVDDEFGMAEITADLLVQAGFVATTAINGRLALVSIGETRPDVILLDVMMPVMSGDELLRVLKADPRYCDIPVVMMSAAGDDAVPEDLRDTIAGFLQKPFTYDELIGALRTCLPPQR